jgi:hypothetical protein
MLSHYDLATSLELSNTLRLVVMLLEQRFPSLSMMDDFQPAIRTYPELQFLARVVKVAERFILRGMKYKVSRLEVLCMLNRKHQARIFVGRSSFFVAFERSKSFRQQRVALRALE